MMKKIFAPWIIVVLTLLFTANLARAEQCPTAASLAPYVRPPEGWTFLVPPIMRNWEYSFAGAFYSYNQAFYYQRIICRYDACPRNDYYLCPAFTIVSDNIYPETKSNLVGTWFPANLIENAVTCQPDDHNPSKCTFSRK